MSKASLDPFIRLYRAFLARSMPDDDFDLALNDLCVAKPGRDPDWWSQWGPEVQGALETVYFDMDCHVPGAPEASQIARAQVEDDVRRALGVLLRATGGLPR